MHISEGVLPPAFAAAGWVVGAMGVGLGLRKLEIETMPRTAMVTAAFFTASLIHVPVGFGHTHLVLNGLAGILLGWAAFPALAVALFLQAVLFQFGGIGSLGINLLIMAIPAVLCGTLFRMGFKRRVWKGPRLWVAAFGTGLFSVWFSALLQAGILAACHPSFRLAAATLALIHAVSGPVEGIITASVVSFLIKVRPALLGAGGDP